MNIVTLMNFVRSADDRTERKDMVDAVRNQARLSLEYKLPTTFMLQHDALADKEILDLIPHEDYIEIGLWLELNRTLVTSAGGVWEAEKEWDWHSNFDLTCGYPPEIRKNIIDIAMKDFKAVFGYYPKTIGSWEIDAVTLKYLEDNYDIDCSINCKEQWGTDGYSMWGGYYSQAFYPTVNNAFCPAGNKESQINIPIFRGLGLDVVDQYDCESDDNGQNVISMEPACPDSGGNKTWVTWFMDQLINNDKLSFGYVQIGQENSFGWKLMSEGYKMQIQLMDELLRDKKITMMTMQEAGRWYKENYAMTPASVNFAIKKDKYALWYCNKNFRFGMYSDSNLTYIRDIMVFDDNYFERYLADTCKTKDSYYDNLPLVDGYRWSEKLKGGGLFFSKDGNIIRDKSVVSYNRLDPDTVEVAIKYDEFTDKIVLAEKTIEIFTDYSVSFVYEQSPVCPEIKILDGKLALRYNGFDYEVKYQGKGNDELKTISPVDGKIVFEMV